MFDFPKMVPEPAQDLFPVGIRDFLLQFFQCKVNNIVVMDFVGRDLMAELEPDAV